MVASHHGHTDIVNELARRGAQLDLTTVKLYLLRMYIASCIMLLYTFTQDAGDSAVHIASLQDHADVVKELATHGANLNAINEVCSVL